MTNPPPSLEMDTLSKAIAAHALWKHRLAAAIREGRTDIPPERIEAGVTCEFARWLASLPPAVQQSQTYKLVSSLHAHFHQEAAAVLRLALAGNSADAERAMGHGSAYAAVSAELTNAMTRWQRSLLG